MTPGGLLNPGLTQSFKSKFTQIAWDVVYVFPQILSRLTEGNCAEEMRKTKQLVKT